jgi:hypothetical protein
MVGSPTSDRPLSEIEETIMPMNHSGDLMQALVAKLYQVITGDDDAITIPRNKFVSWYLPGVPFAPDDFRFGARGLTGDDAEGVRNAYHQAFVVASLFDFVPDVSTGFVDNQLQQSIFAGTQDRISSVYNDVLKYSRVVHRELSDKEKAKLEKFRNLLTVEVEETDILTDEVKTVTRPGKLTVAYTEKMNEYLTVADELMNMKIDAMAASGDSEEAKRRVYNWNEKAKFVKNRLKAAEMAWTAQGYRYEYEQISAYIEQVTEKSLVLYKEDLKNKFENSLLTSVADGDSAFYYTTLIPGNWATSEGWTRFTFTEADYETHANKKTNKWGASGGANFGLFSVGAKAGGSRTETSSDQKAENFHAEFEFVQIPIVRPWFDPGFFSMRSWTLDENWDLSYDGAPVSDGSEQPGGRLVAYATSALFIRNVRISSTAWSSHKDFLAKSVEAGGSVGYGPVRIGGSYARGSEETNTDYEFDGETLQVKGLQLIGTINNLIPKSPNPHPDLKPEDFVGGS